MVGTVILAILVTSVFAAPQSDVHLSRDKTAQCDPSICLLPNCLCPSNTPPANLTAEETPQLVLLTFDDAVSVRNIPYYKEAFFDRVNPDGCPVSTTYFVTHEYTDYSLVHDLWSRGHEIALHSITHQTPASYWQELDVEGNKLEFVDQIDLVSHFANIPGSSITGIRLPFLQLSGNNSFQMIHESDLKYDCSWPSQANIDYGLFPYTLDYKSSQDCPIGPCPTAPLPGVWVVPMVDWRDMSNSSCAMVDACVNIPSDEDGLVEFMKTNFHRHYDGTRSPFGFYVHAAWFDTDPIHFGAYKKFLDYLQGLSDVYMVSVQRALDWIQNPIALEDLQNSWQCQTISANTCGAGKSCRLMKGEEERYMTTCASACPNVYPWLGNPLGN